MRTMTYSGDEHGFQVEDDFGQFVDVDFEDGVAYYISFLHGDEEPVFGHEAYDGNDDKHYFNAVSLLGFISVEHLIVKD